MVVKTGVMLSRIMALLMVGLALVAVTAGLPAATCLMTNAPGEMACKPGCCADKACCETSPKSTEPAPQPLARPGPQQPKVNAIPAIEVAAPVSPAVTELPVFFRVKCGAHSPLPLERNCIRLI